MQSRLMSFVESNVSTAVGFILSVLAWEFVVKPVWHLNTSFVTNLQITLLFTVISILRGYCIRRYFVWRAYRDARAHRPAKFSCYDYKDKP